MSEMEVCATEGCGISPASYYEAGGIGSYYCADCLSKIRVTAARLDDIINDRDNFYRPEIKSMANEILELRTKLKSAGK